MLTRFQGVCFENLLIQQNHGKSVTLRVPDPESATRRNSASPASGRFQKARADDQEMRTSLLPGQCAVGYGVTT